MKKLTSKTVVENVKFITSDNREYSREYEAKLHEKLFKQHKKLTRYDLEWLEDFLSGAVKNNADFNSAFKSNKVILILTHSGGESPEFTTVEPNMAAVKAVIKAMHRRTLGCNYNEYVVGIIYKKESFHYFIKKDDRIGTGEKNIEEGLENKEAKK